LPGRAGVECRASSGACDVAEVCDGGNASCPDDSGLPDQMKMVLVTLRIFARIFSIRTRPTATVTAMVISAISAPRPASRSLLRSKSRS
jgi:hypothetical protein